jgi:hypothetical protein
MNKTCNFQSKVTYIKITNTLISVLRRKSLKEPWLNRILFKILFHLPLVARVGIWRGLASGIA